MAFILFWLDKNVPERSIMPFLIYFSPCMSRLNKMLFGPGLTLPFFSCFFFFLSFFFFYWLPGLCCRKGYCYFLLHLKKKKKEASHRRYYFNLCRIFTKKETVSVEKIIIFLCLGFLCPPLSFSHLSEKPVELKSNAFSYCNFVYWFSMRAWLCVCVCVRVHVWVHGCVCIDLIL